MAVLTGYAQKAKQVEQLRRMGLLFFVNAAGRPIVARAIVEGRRSEAEPVKPTWEPAWAKTMSRTKKSK